MSLISGIFEASRGGGHLRDPEISLSPTQEDPWVPPRLVKQFRLTNGASVRGHVRSGRRGPEIREIEAVCGLEPEAFRDRTPFVRLTAISPHDRFRLGQSGTDSARIIELIAPIGKGTRGLIVAPPKVGKTRLLEEIAAGIRHEDPDARILILLIDERPEEVTHFRRSVDAEVLASSNDEGRESHVRLAELVMAHVRCELECGRHVVVLLDSLTRLVRAFNLQGRGSGRTLSGGVDAAALEIPRRIFGLARTIENGGSVTVIATALVETGSRMDDFLFQEFKGTGNSELILDRSLAEARIFPAIDLLASGTRRDELLFSDEEMKSITALRRWLARGTPKAAMIGLLRLIERTDSNEELLLRIDSAGE